MSGRGVWLSTVVCVWGWTYSRYFFNLSLVWLLAALAVVVIIIRAGDVPVSYCKDLKVAVITPTSAQGGQMPCVCTWQDWWDLLCI